MRILHTADVHIKDVEDLRWLALCQIIHTCRVEKVDFLVISGDLFDNRAKARQLRPKIRELFSGNPFHTILVPGNHDAEAYPEGTFLGDTVTIIDNLLKPLEFHGVFFWGFPYKDLLEEEVLAYLHHAASIAPANATHILLFHGELLDITGTWDHYGEETRKRYLPVKLAYFQTLPWHYILAGHFHSNFDVHQFRKSGYFVYPGSPVSITRREVGLRKVNLFDIGSAPAPYPLETPYFEKIELHLTPFQKENPLQLLARRLEPFPEHAHLLLEIDGYFNSKLLGMSETELQQALSRISGRKVEIVKMAFQDIHEIAEHDLFKHFLEKLNHRSLGEEERQRVLQVTLQAMMELSA